MPLSYPDGTLAEHRACRSGSAVFDVSHLGTVRVEGPGALDRLQAAFTNDLTKIQPGRAQYTHLLAEDGSVSDDIIVWWVAEQRFDVMPNASNTSGVLAALGADSVGDDTIADVTSTRAVLAVQGPEAQRAGLGAPRGRRRRTVPCMHRHHRGARRPGGGGDGGGHRLHRRGRGRDRPANRPRRSALGRVDCGGCYACRPGGPGHASPGGRIAAPRFGTGSRHHHAERTSRLGRGLGQAGRLPRPGCPRCPAGLRADAAAVGAPDRNPQAAPVRPAGPPRRHRGWPREFGQLLARTGRGHRPGVPRFHRRARRQGDHRSAWHRGAGNGRQASFLS